jgi:ABC-type multidrug transport system ATPase subunit
MIRVSPVPPLPAEPYRWAQALTFFSTQNVALYCQKSRLFSHEVIIMEVKIVNLSKIYNGDIRALNQVSLNLNNGMFGLLGPNGAGKTTLMRIVATLLPATDGDVLVNGLSVRRQPAEVRRLLGYLPQSFNTYPQLTVGEFLDYFAILSGVQEGRARRVSQVLEQVNLSEQQRMRTSKLSGGMKRRLGIGQALLNDPQLLIVDEPTAGLDPAERVRFRNFLSTLSGERVIVLSTHIVEDVASTCKDLAVLFKGQVLLRGTPRDLADKARGKVWVLTTSEEEWPALQKEFHILGSVRVDNGWQVRLLADESPAAGAVSAQPTIEDGYMALVEVRTLQ